jgi:lipopolysaccharide assembly outer membrane protein LptD (OstA)
MQGRAPMKFCALFLFLAALYLPTLAPSQQSADPGTEEPRQEALPSAGQDSVYRISARTSAFKDTLGEKVLELIDNVRIVHGNVTVTADHALQYRSQRVSHLTGDVTILQETLRMEGEEGEYFRFQDRATLWRNVRITDRDWKVHCDRAVFYRKSGMAWLIGNVEAYDSATTLVADTIIYDRNRAIAEAFGRVTITSATEGFTVSGRHGFYYKDLQEGLIDEDPHLIVDAESPEPAEVDSDTMRFYPDDERAAAYGRVKIIKGQTITQCDSAAVFDELQRVELYGKPLAKQENVSMQGDTMVLHYNDEEVNRINIVGSARIEERQADPLISDRDSWIQGDSMTLYLNDNRVDSIQVLDNCSSEYYPSAVNRIESNYAAGDTMFFHFERDTLAYVRITGKSTGIYKYFDVEDNATCDSLRAVADTSLTFVPFAENAEKVEYAGKRIEYFAREKDIALHSQAKVVYQNRTLLGDNIIYHSALQLLDATGSPVLIEGGDKFYGREMGYDLESGIGVVQEGSTKFMEGFYYGEEVAKVGDNVMKVWHSTYTTCDLKKPHFHFASNEMKVYLKDKVVSGPITLYVGKTPLFYLPFMANNIQKGRKSGVLRPDFEFGITKSTGRYIRNFGYYWATNDYTDFQVLGDFNEDSSFRLHAWNRYKLRYVLSGNVNYSFFRDLQDYTNKWTLSSTHSQTLGEKFTFTSDISLVSSEDAPRAISRIDQVEDVINRRIESKFSLGKSWSSTRLSASGRRVQYLNVTDPKSPKVQTTFPQLSLSIPSRTLYFGKETKLGKKGVVEQVLGGILYSPGISGSRKTEKKEYNSSETITGILSMNFSFPFDIGFLTIKPSLTTNDTYTRTTKDTLAHVDITTGAEPETTSVRSRHLVETDNEFRWSTGGRMSTKFYGTFYPEIGSLRGFRHTLSPSASYSYFPAVGSRPASQKVNVSLDNAFDLKVRNGEKDKKLPGILIWGLNASYNPQAPKREGWSDIASRMNLKLFGTTISMSNSFDPYDRELLSTSITSSISLHGSHGFGKSQSAADQELNVVASDTTGSTAVTIESSGEDPGEPVLPETKGDTWNLSLSFSYNKSQFGDPRATVNANSTFNLTKNWRITYSMQYDLQNRMLMRQSFDVYRNLHCWEMSFAREKLGEEWQYYFRIHVKAHTEIYAESGRRGLGRGGFGQPFSF